MYTTILYILIGIVVTLAIVVAVILRGLGKAAREIDDDYPIE